MSDNTDKLDFKNDEGFRLTSIRKSFDDDKRIITCVAMAAYEIDAHGDMFLPSAVQGAAYSFVADYNISKSIDKQHSALEDIDADLVGSFYVEKGLNIDGLDVPDFSWVSQLRINDDATWTQVKKSELTGLSIFGEASGWKVNDQVEKAFAFHLEKAKAGDSQYTKPLRIFDYANPSKLSVVDAGANLHLAVYKRKEQIMAETRETVQTEAMKAKDPAQTEASAPATATPIAASEIAAPVEKAAAPPAPVENPVQSLIRKMAIAESLDLDMLRKAYDQIGTALHIPGTPAVAPAPVVTPPAPAPDTALSTAIAKAVNDATAEMRKELGETRSQLDELRKAKVASSGASDPEADPETANVAKSAHSKNVFGESFTGFFGR